MPRKISGKLFKNDKKPINAEENLDPPKESANSRKAKNDKKPLALETESGEYF